MSTYAAVKKTCANIAGCRLRASLLTHLHIFTSRALWGVEPQCTQNLIIPMPATAVYCEQHRLVISFLFPLIPQSVSKHLCCCTAGNIVYLSGFMAFHSNVSV